MIIEFNHQEKMLLEKTANNYRKRTKDNPSYNYIVNLLRCHYEDNLQKDMSKILDQKVREYNEAQAEKGKSQPE